jgi:hypothetical protein
MFLCYATHREEKNWLHQYLATPVICLPDPREGLEQEWENYSFLIYSTFTDKPESSCHSDNFQHTEDDFVSWSDAKVL